MSKVLRLKKELKSLLDEPVPGIFCSFDENSERIDCLAACRDSPYQDLEFKVQIRIPERYPFEPPNVLMLTPIYHPNIDEKGRICLDLLKMPPSGSWKPIISISIVLQSLRVLLESPNPDDPLVVEIADEYKRDAGLFFQKAHKFALRHASRVSLPPAEISPNNHILSNNGASSSKDKIASIPDISMDLPGAFQHTTEKRPISLSKKIKR